MDDKNEHVSIREQALEDWTRELDMLHGCVQSHPNVMSEEWQRALTELVALRARARKVLYQVDDDSHGTSDSRVASFDQIWGTFKTTLRFLKAEVARELGFIVTDGTLLGSASTTDVAEESAPSLRQCPKCSAAMQPIVESGVIIDRCVGCGGLWFDLLEHEHLKMIEDSERIDTGDPAVGKRYNTMSHVNCPVCQTRLIAMVDAAQPHIWYEACTTCYGVFFDAGEFSDFKGYSAWDAIRSFITPERPA